VPTCRRRIVCVIQLRSGSLRPDRYRRLVRVDGIGVALSIPFGIHRVALERIQGAKVARDFSVVSVSHIDIPYRGSPRLA
jgi:hypothetical protein